MKQQKKIPGIFFLPGFCIAKVQSQQTHRQQLVKVFKIAKT
jgi:hypothetical protein